MMTMVLAVYSRVGSMLQAAGVGLEDLRDLITAQATDAARFWSELIADPDRMAAEVAAAKEQRRVRAG